MTLNGPVPKEEPEQIPLVAIPANTVDQLERYRHMLDASIRADNPAMLTLTALAGKGVVEAADRNHLGTPRPSEMMIGIDSSNTYLYLVPVPAKTPGATKVKYNKSQMQLNLYPLFSKLDRLVPEDVREYYDVNPTPAEVTIGHIKGWGVYINLTKAIKEKISRLTDEEKARRKAMREQKDSERKARQNATKESAPARDPASEEKPIE